MAKKRSAQTDDEKSTPKQLRKRLRKAEDQLADAVGRRDQAQARVEALSIIADEIRAQLADADKAEEIAAAASAGAPPKPVAAATVARKPGSKKRAAPTVEPVAADRDPAGGAPATGA